MGGGVIFTPCYPNQGRRGTREAAIESSYQNDSNQYLIFLKTVTYKVHVRSKVNGRVFGFSAAFVALRQRLGGVCGAPTAILAAVVALRHPASGGRRLWRSNCDSAAVVALRHPASGGRRLWRSKLRFCGSCGAPTSSERWAAFVALQLRFCGSCGAPTSSERWAAFVALQLRILRQLWRSDIQRAVGGAAVGRSNRFRGLQLLPRLC